MAESFPLAVSNIAWDAADDAVVAAMLVAEGATGVEIAPTKWHATPADATPAEIRDYRTWWEDRGLRIVAMQSLLFGRPELQLFGSDDARSRMSDYLRRIVDLGAGLGARALVFGSPKNRTRGDLPVAAAADIAIEFFTAIGEHAAAREVAMCLEPVPPRYGCDFLTTPREALDLARAIDSPAIRVNADLGAMTLAAEDPADALTAAGSLVGHYHASELDFVPVSASDAHVRGAEGLRQIGYQGWVSLEMAKRDAAMPIGWIGSAVRAARSVYVRS